MVRKVIYQSSFLLLLLTTLFFISCGDKYCEESGSGMPLVGIYAMGTPPVEANVDSLTVYGVIVKDAADYANDSILYNNVSKIHTFYTPLSITTDTVKYVLRYESKLVPEEFKRDTLTYIYRKNLTFETSECGATFSYVIDDFKYTTHSIAYAELITPEVNSIESQTVKIYYVAKD